MHEILFSPRAARSFRKIPKQYQIRIKEKLAELARNPQMPGTIKLVDYPVASFRLRVGNWRILFDIDTQEKILEIIDIRKRDENTYK